MKKVLLVFEEYAELVAIEILLKKVGFDTIGLTREATVDEKMLYFSPDLLIASGVGERVNVMNLARKFRDREKPKVMLVFSNNSRPSPKELLGCRIDSLLTAPVDPEKLLSLCARLCEQAENMYVDKLNKILQSNDEELDQVRDSQFFKIAGPPPSHSKLDTGDEAARIANYKSQIENLPEPEVKTLNANDAKKRQKQLEAEWDMERVEKLNSEKKAFARALFDSDEESG